jgi:SWI/SNF-related matrix-associated actin-dependent regulator 1 of chromatin subfamily A
VLMSRILVSDSSPITSPGDGDNGPRYQPGNAIVHAMTSSNGVNHFTKTKFRKSLSPTTGKINGHADSQSMQRGNSSSSGLTSMAARINARSEKALPPKVSASKSFNRRERSASAETTDSHGSQKRFKTDVERFKYQGPGDTKRRSPIVIDDDDASSLSSAGPSEEQPKKKKRFILGGRGKGSRITSEDESWEAKTNTAPTSLSARSEEPDISEEVQRAAEGIVNLYKKWDMDIVISELKKREHAGKLDKMSAISSLRAHYQSMSMQSSSKSGPQNKVNTSPPQRTASYLKGTTPHRPIGKGIQVTSRISSASPVFVSHNKVVPPPRKEPISKVMERVKSNTNSTRSSISISDDDSDQGSDGSSDDGYERESKNDRAALVWFNTVDEQQLMDIINISEVQARTIIDLRPFASKDDVISKLSDKSAKGVTSKLFINCVDLMAGLQQVDGVLEKCERMGNKLNAEVEKWRNATVEGGGDEFYLQGQPMGLSEGVKLKEFQLHGVNWLNLLYRKECSGILADDMGLGKTAQVIAFLNVIVQRDRKRPHLIVVPSSVLTNWLREFSVFGPKLRVFKYHGSQAERGEQRHTLKYGRDDYDVILTTYDMASGAEQDHNFLRKYGFDACIYDEGHILKNQKSNKYQKLLKLRADWRLLLTGTPLQNNLGELISLLKFIMPSYFRGAEEALAQIFKVNHQSQLSKERVGRAKTMMQPFVLRRKKIDVLLDLKPKTEVVKYCDMTADQNKIYKEAYAKSKAALRQQEEQVAQAALTRGKKATLSKNQSGHVLMELRKAANHPLLFRRLFTDKKLETLARDYLKNSEHADEDLAMKKEDFAINSDAELSMSVAAQYKSCHKHMLAPNEWLNSGKIAALRQVIEEAASQGERLIIFSQFVQTLEIICRALEVLQISYRGFTGSTDVDSRQEIVDEFTRDDSIRCFLLSTRAGGVGINLTAANWVVLFDQDFNPQNDRQAADRAYRIGQEKQVTIVRLISKNTIDEHILELGKGKLKLAERVEGNAVDEEEMAANNEEVEAKVEQTLLARLAQDDDDDDTKEDATKSS